MTIASLAIDWGSTNRRVFALDAKGAVLETDRDALGVLAMAGRDFAAEVAALRARFGDVPVLIAGMAGSNRGWTDAGYVPVSTGVPANLAGLAAALCWVEPGFTAIVPGVSRQDGRCDVMRGEEVQFLGACAAGMVPTESLLCQPGTHAKWAVMAGGAITDFTTAVVGEVFAMLGKGGLLAEGLDLPAQVGPAFRAGVLRGREGDLLAALFGARAALVLGERERTDQASYVSGLLIGADVAQRISPGARVHVLADPSLGALYLAALDVLGASGVLVDSHGAFIAGINAIRAHITRESAA